MADQDLTTTRRQRGFDVNGIVEELYTEVTAAEQDGATGEKAIFTIPKGVRVIDAYVDVQTGATGTTFTTALILDDGSNKTIIGSIDGKTAALTRMGTGGQQISSAGAGYIKLNHTVLTAITVQPVFRVRVVLLRETN